MPSRSNADVKQTEQWAALLHAISNAPTDDLQRWARIAEDLNEKLTPMERRNLAGKLRKRLKELSGTAASTSRS